MTKYAISKKSKKAFLRWCAKGDASYQSAISYALETLLPVVEEAGFKWVEKSPDGFKTPSFMIDLERPKPKGIERININFDKYKKLNFSVTGTISEKSTPYRRIVISRIVKYKSEFAKASIWGASIFSLNKRRVFKKEADRVAKLLPQLINFLDTGNVGPNIYKFENQNILGSFGEENATE